MLRKPVLESLEAGGPAEPNGFFKSYARRYAGFLGLDGDEIVASFSSRLPSETAGGADANMAISAHEHRWKGVSAFTRKRSLGPVFLVVVIALAVAVALLSRQWPVTVPSPGGQTDPSNASNTPSVPSTSLPSTVPVTPSGAQVDENPPASQIVTLRFEATTQRAWLEITADGRVVFSGILRPGDSTQAAGRYVVVDFGNAMYTRISIDGSSGELVSADQTVMTMEYGSPPAAP